LALALLFQLGREDLMAERFGHQPLWQEVAQMLRADINCPPSSSLGRLFDAVAGLMAVCDVQTFEAQAAMLLEAQVRRLPEPDAALWRVSDGNCLDLTPLLQRLLEMDNAPEGAECFHANLIAALAAWAGKAAHEQGISDVILSGGCLLNSWLRTGLVDALQRQGLTPRLPINLPPGDAALSLGQVWVSIMRANVERERGQG
jgi:hydrogenase maturation protein HypF